MVDTETRLVLNDYLLSLKMANKAPATINKYRLILEMFFRDMSTPLEALPMDEVFDWLEAYGQTKKEKTRALVLTTLSRFFAFCQAEDYIDRPLVKTRWRPTIPDSLPKYLDDAEVTRMKMSAETYSLRDRAIITFLLSSGCRRTEASMLNTADVSFSNRSAVVTGKGRKLREIHFSEECRLLLEAYLRTRSSPSDAAPMFLNRFGERLKPIGIYKVVRKLRKETGLPSDIGPHHLRHTFATQMLARGADLSFIGDEMGHTDLNTTRIYARIPTEDMKAAYQKIME
ncbi:tyrosine-type recombinase/integrase [Salibacterium qingdaonense]|uniref:Integrase/recombinase XerD n=1 Tax=Salibacterium qingdaonense TaxID=266892 RepID=A0A1I4Q104_9BACI|nr:tyrosine-type recombinase/integrase [Salibacterium qingdaonense]SFM33758.1 integrase/recombinase XerD [Salibacterium qingdaonense]